VPVCTSSVPCPQVRSSRSIPLPRASGVKRRGEPEDLRQRLESLRALYEPYAVVLSEHVELALPPWLGRESPSDNWRTAAWH
jgi:hypothetical protein